jgi:CRP-like cAMP-binding protein
VHSLENSRSDQIVRALTDVVVVSIPEARSTTKVCRDRHLATSIVKGLIQRMLRYEESLIDLVTEPTEKRLAKFLLRFETRGLSGWAEIPNLTNPEIASKIGTTRWQVSRHVNRLKHLNIVRRAEGMWVNFDLLRAFVKSERRDH